MINHSTCCCFIILQLDQEIIHNVSIAFDIQSNYLESPKASTIQHFKKHDILNSFSTISTYQLVIFWRQITM
jgi:hypothetical protein